MLLMTNMNCKTPCESFQENMSLCCDPTEAAKRLLKLHDECDINDDPSSIAEILLAASCAHGAEFSKAETWEEKPIWFCFTQGPSGCKAL